MSQERVIEEGMGGAGGGDLDDMGDDGYPLARGDAEDVERGAFESYRQRNDDKQFDDAIRMVAGDVGDDPMSRQMCGVSDDLTAELPGGNTDADEAANNSMARGLDAAGSHRPLGASARLDEVGAPWDCVDDPSRIGGGGTPS